MNMRNTREPIPVMDRFARRQMCINAARKIMRTLPDTTSSALTHMLAKRGYTLGDLVHAKIAVTSDMGDAGPSWRDKVDLSHLTPISSIQ